MAAGDVYTPGIASVAASGYFNMQPTIGTEIVVHNISHTGSATLEFYDSDTLAFVVVDAHTNGGAWVGMFLHCTFTKYYRVKNVLTFASNICCDGVMTK